MNTKSHTNIVIFASGNGSNALNIINHFENKPRVKIVAVFCNNPEAKVMTKANLKNIEVFLFNRNDLQNTDNVLKKLDFFSTDIIVLAGFLLKIPESIIRNYSQKIVNIHPALLPKYGGKGMYGSNVHKAVINNREKESGITIHYVNENYDEGAIIFQAKCKLTEEDTPEDLAQKINKLEMQYFPGVIEGLIEN